MVENISKRIKKFKSDEKKVRNVQKCMKNEKELEVGAGKERQTNINSQKARKIERKPQNGQH